MWRVLLLLAAALVVADTTGLLPEVDDVECRDEPEGKQCPPACATCTCAWHSLQTTPASVIVVDAAPFAVGTVELPEPSSICGLLAQPPSLRPPIRPS